MSGIKYYQLRNGEELPDEFCVVRDINGEPSEYTWYERTGEVEHDLMAENAKLRELLQRTWDAFHDATQHEFVRVKNDLRELGNEVDQ